MLVGVDETGDFRDGSRALFAAAFVRPSERECVTEALRGWERRTRRRLRVDNEIKGRDLDQRAALQFVSDVVGSGGNDAVVYMVFAVDVSMANLAAMDVQRQAFVEGYEGWAEMQSQSQDLAGERFARQLTQMAGWVRARSNRQLLKFVTLGAILPPIVEHAFGFSIARGFDHELIDLRLHLDRGYVKRSEMVMWRDILRSIFISRTCDHPIPLSTEWGPDHPVLQTFVEQQAGAGVLLKSTFKERIDFYDSAATPVVRLADVMASIVRRGAHGGDLARPFGELRRRCLHRYFYKLLQWNDKRQPPIRNPYLEFTAERGS